MFLDYHRTIVGYHGTSATQAESIVRAQRFRASRNNHDWLGHGVYFWEYAPKQALWWAKRKHGTDAAVVGAMIRLGNCLDLLDPEVALQLKRFHDELETARQLAGSPLPSNHNTKKYRDCAVLESFYAAVGDTEPEIQTSRGVYVPTPGSAGIDGGGGRLWERSWLTLDAHIQVCVRDTTCIIGVWPVPVS